MTETATLQGIRRLNWGCGQVGEPGWINSDIKEGPRIDISCDITQGLPLETDSIDYAVSIHALPEIHYDDQVTVLRELRRVLKPGGPLRLALPDIERSIAAYQRGDRSFYLIPDDDMKTLGGKFILQLIWYGYAKTFFTRDFIGELLEKAGFSRIEHVAFRRTASPHPGIVELDNREEESLFVEAYK
jgi:predicted SAM-dependent methyltransferase